MQWITNKSGTTILDINPIPGGLSEPHFGVGTARDMKLCTG